MDPIDNARTETRRSELADRAVSDEPILIFHDGRPIARLFTYARPSGKRRELGLLAGKGWIADDFDAPLPEDILADFERHN